MQLNEQVAIVTGGGRGLGRAYALALAAAGAAVAVTARSTPELQEVVQEIEKNGGRALAIPADVTDAKAVTQMVATVEQALGPVDLLINNAGVVNEIGLLADVEMDKWWRDVEINVRGPFNCSRAVLPGMMRRKRGRIINLASGAGLQSFPWLSAYCVSKTALIRLTESLAMETEEHGIAVFAIHPGTVRTAMTTYVTDSEFVKQRAPGMRHWFRQIFAEGKDTPIERTVEFLMWLASGQADALSGRYLDVDVDRADLLRRTEEIEQQDRLALRLAGL